MATSIFALATSGSGTVKGVASIAGNTPPANGAMLNIGEGYTLTAVPAANFVLTNWTSNRCPNLFADAPFHNGAGFGHRR